MAKNVKPGTTDMAAHCRQAGREAEETRRANMRNSFGGAGKREGTRLPPAAARNPAGMGGVARLSEAEARARQARSIADVRRGKK
ncbi:hypothetical protein [Anaeromyxobacter oryzae]|uniref:Stress-induced protein n=1 Tax=Anaeromyxobacter oryzae TaxID=2918170 RepID=A0ABN6MVD1_9BACT|nr:hypothetical protein [Anaeromyxobacter oryzae]BDG04944.1 hypothetical protein AMOR_39400 [Anaeromyxobacter oryzae]